MVEQRELRNIFGHFASGVTVITCRNADGDPHGATVTAFTSVSMEPRLCQVTMTRKSKACKYLSAAPFAVNVLAGDQVDAAMHFAGRALRPRAQLGGRAHRPDPLRCLGHDLVRPVGRVRRRGSRHLHRRDRRCRRHRQTAIAVLPQRFPRPGCALGAADLDRMRRRPGNRLVRRHPVLHPHARLPNRLKGGIQK